MSGDSSIKTTVLKGELVLDTIKGERYRVLYISPESQTGYWIKVDSSSNIPKLIDLKELEMKLKTRSFETILDQNDEIDESAISPARRSERNRIFDLIQEMVSDEPDIYDRKGRAERIEEQSKKSGVAKAKLYNYLGRFWRGGMTRNALLPRYDKRGPGSVEIVYEKRTGRPKRSGENGKILGSEDKEKFEKAIASYYMSDKKPTLRETYDWMIAKMYTKPRFKGDTDPEQLPADEKPSYNQFYYWHLKTKDIVAEQKERESNRYELTSRGATGKSETHVIGPGMVAQIDATIADYYLVRENHRNELVGRPVMFFVKDVKTHIIMGLYVTLDNTSWDCAMMALKNTVEDKVEFCKRYGIHITPEEWPCHHLPMSITADNGEMGDKGVEEVIARLGITIENTPPYRGDLKAIIEKNFDMINLKLRYIVPGHVDKDDGQRGSINRRKEACVDLRTFTQMIIRCVLYYNNYHYMETYPKTPEMRKYRVNPIPRELWNYGMQFQSGALRIISREDIYRILLPRDKASVTDRGICFRNLYYTCEKAANDLWFDKARIGGRWTIPVLYDPTCLAHIYFQSEDGALVKCSLLEKSTMYEATSEEDLAAFKEQDRAEKAEHAQKDEQAKTNLILELNDLVERCKKEKKNEGKEAVGSVLNKHKIREQRIAEREEQSGEAAAKKAQEQSEPIQSHDSDVEETFETAGDAFDRSIDEALRGAGIFID